jgi:methylenetetrahydrofolate dehydrogenase (NADP+)/methenyltetrahydrofolate cyclohydrolase
MILSGRELASYIKQRHYQQTRGMIPKPRLAIIMGTNADAATRAYVRSTKSRYAEDIGAIVDVHEVKADKPSLVELIDKLNADEAINGIIIQLPFEGVDSDELLAQVSPSKDVDGLGPQSQFDPATPKAILWLLSSYTIDWRDKTVVVVGQGRLVGAPLSKMLEASGAKVIRCDDRTPDLKAETLKADIVVTAVGKPKLITKDMVGTGTVIVDAGTADVGGNLVGDVDHDLYDKPSLKITPNPGGVGPMTVAALFDNLLLAANQQRDQA